MYHKTILLVGLLVFAAFAGIAQDSSDMGPARPAAFGIVVDNSGTFRLALERAIKLLSPVAKAKGPADRGFLVTYTEPAKAVVRQPFTDDAEELSDAIENIYVEAGRSAVWDGIKFAAEYLIDDATDEPPARRILIIVTDGDDSGSIVKPDTVMRLLKDNGIRVVVVGLADQRVSERMIDRLVKETGGKRLLPRSPEELKVAAEEILLEVRP